MGFIPQITCRHCGKQFSAIHNRCPHCGTRRVKQTSRTPVTTASVKQGTAASARASSNTRWQFIFGCVIVVAVIVAVIVLITASIGGGKPSEPTPTPTLDVTPSPTPTPTPTPTPSPTPTTATSITITFLGESKEEFAMSVGDEVDLEATVYPVEAQDAVEWRSEDESICTVDKDGVVTGVGSGWGKVIAQCGGVAVECKVWVR